MLKAIIVDANAITRGLLNTVLTEGGYNVVGQAHTVAAANAAALKHQPHFICIARDQFDDGIDAVELLQVNLPKMLIFMVSGDLDGPAIGSAVARGVHGFIVKPFKADTVLRTIRNTIIAIVNKHRAG
jgi:two-component system chemotaxis response regulator CheY